MDWNIIWINKIDWKTVLIKSFNWLNARRGVQSVVVTIPQIQKYQKVGNSNPIWRLAGNRQVLILPMIYFDQMPSLKAKR